MFLLAFSWLFCICFCRSLISLVFIGYVSPFSIFCKADLGVLSSLSFCLSIKLLISPSILNEIFARYSNLDCRFVSFSTLIMSCIPLWPGRDSAERGIVNHMGFPLLCYLLSFPCCFFFFFWVRQILFIFYLFILGLNKKLINLFILLYNIVLILPYIDLNLPWVYMCSPSWTPLPPPSPSNPSGSSQCTSPEHPVSCIEPGLVIHFTYDNLHVSMPFSHIIMPLPSATESKRLFNMSVSLLLSCI